MSDAERAGRIEQNERLFEAVNEAVRKLNVKLGIEDSSEHYVCECSIQDCVEQIPPTRDEYAEVRTNPDWFFMIREHRDPAHETVIRETDRYALVEKAE